MPPEGSDLIFDHRHNTAFRASAWSVGLAGGHGGGRICLREGAGAAQCIGRPVPVGYVPDPRSAASAAGIPAAVTNNGPTEDPCTTGMAWVAVPNRDLVTPVTGMPDSASG